jgi:hypothetical protein
MTSRARQIYLEHAAPMRRAHQRFSHPEQFIRRAIGWTLICRRPRRATVFTGKNAYLSAYVEELGIPGVNRQTVYWRLRQRSSDVAPPSAAIGGFPHIIFRVTAERNVDGFVIARVDGDAGAEEADGQGIWACLINPLPDRVVVCRYPFGKPAHLHGLPRQDPDYPEPRR